ncbi:MAG: fimbrillin family protein [Bacteroidales bacterium]|nr:fimbrillin family protein [Bacteroidales bacterium]
MKKHWDILFLTFLFLSGCGQKDLPEAVPIAFKAHFKLGTEVNVYSKAPVTNLTDMGTIYICRADGTVVDYSGLNQPTLSGTVQTDGTVTPSLLQYYQTDGTPANFIAFHPQAYSMSNGIVNFRITGQEDIMAGICNYAGYAQNPVTVTFGFSHLLSQLDYEIVAESQAAADAWGTLTYIKVTTPTSLDLDLNSNILTTNTDPVEQDLLSSLGNNAAVPITTTYSSAGNVMIPSHNAQLILKIKTSTSEELTIPTNLWYLAPGNIHKITLTFKGNATGIPLTATLSGWPE